MRDAPGCAVVVDAPPVGAAVVVVVEADTVLDAVPFIVFAGPAVVLEDEFIGEPAVVVFVAVVDVLTELPLSVEFAVADPGVANIATQKRK